MRKLLFLCASVLSTLSFGSGKTEVFQGKLRPFAEALAGDKKISGTAMMKKSASGAEFKLSVKGLDKNEAYVSHVHALPCSVEKAGGHYKFDPSIKTAIEANEIWFEIPSHKEFVNLEKHVYVPLTDDAKSVVVHRMKGEEMVKVACADLKKGH